MNDDQAQDYLHTVFDAALHEAGALEPAALTTGWVICYEFLDDDGPHAGRIYGPAGMTSWRALGLTEFMGRTDGFREGSEESRSIDERDDEENA